MNRKHTLRSPTFYEGSRKHNLYCDVVQDQWSHMDSHPDWPHENPRWVNTQHSDQRIRRDPRDIVTPTSPSPYPNYLSLERPEPQYRQGRSTSYRSPVSPQTPSRELLLPTYYQPAPRCASQPSRMRNESLRSGWPEPEQHQGRRESEYQNDMDYQLFVEATSGLSPDGSHHLSFHPPSIWQREQLHQQQQSQRPDLRGETPYENLTFIHPSQPLHSAPNLLIRRPATRSPAPQPPLYNARPVPEYWQPSPDREVPDWQLRAPIQTPTWQQPQHHDYDDMSEAEEQLPDYAQSQAETFDRRRQEAKRRAEELQTRWRQRHSR